MKVISYILLNIFIFIAYKRVLRKYYFDKLTNMRKIIESGKEAKNMYLEEERDLEEFWYVIKDWQNQNLANIEKLKREKSKLDKLISLIDVGVLVCNAKKTIVSSNWEFRYNFYNDINSEKYNEKIRNLEIIDFINLLYEEKVQMTREIYIHDTKKYFIVKGRYLKKENLYILSVKDITQSKEHQRIEKKFISNVSHELKTPLTNIKGYLIAVEEETDEGMRKNFLDIAQRNIEKLENIIKDFLSLQKMETFSMVNKYPISIDELLDEVESEMENIIKERGAVIYREIQVEDINNYVNADKEKIKILFKNLIENAIIYNDKENPEIRIGVEEKKKYLKFRISDNGIGIPEAEIKNIFNRFYRVDKARTSNKAGTGLGLSIVKEIVEVYSGRVEIESEEGKGTTFNIRVLK
jgi:two-component system phosphate regulon sensor histidine kinase PhoR